LTAVIKPQEGSAKKGLAAAVDMKAPSSNKPHKYGGAPLKMLAAAELLLIRLGLGLPTGGHVDPVAALIVEFLIAHRRDVVELKLQPDLTRSAVASTRLRLEQEAHHKLAQLVGKLREHRYRGPGRLA